METESLIRADIVRLRDEIDRLSCAQSEKALETTREVFIRLLSEDYNNSYFLYIGCILVTLLSMYFVFLLLYHAFKMLNEWSLRRGLSRELHQSPIVAKELHRREMSQASYRSARRRTLFVVTLKCVVGMSVLVLFFGMRVMMELCTRGWLKGLLTSPKPDTGADFSLGADSFDLGEELYFGLMLLLSVNWFKDLQSLFLFSTIGSGVMVFALRLLRSASEDVMSISTESPASLQFLKLMDDKHTAEERQRVETQLFNMMEMLTTLVTPSVEAVEDNGETSAVEDSEEASAVKDSEETNAVKDNEETNAVKDNEETNAVNETKEGANMTKKTKKEAKVSKGKEHAMEDKQE